MGNTTSLCNHVCTKLEELAETADGGGVARVRLTVASEEVEKWVWCVGDDEGIRRARRFDDGRVGF